MRVTMIGHASLLVEAEGCTALLDPVLFDPHQEGVLHVAPPRRVRVDRLPRLDLIIVSHRHLDHFDIRSLAHLPRAARVLIPDDPLLAECARRLGYDDVHRLRDLEEVRVGGAAILATRSTLRVPEHGFVFADASGSVWDQVDTRIDAACIEEARAFAGGALDSMLAAWQPLLEVDYQLGRPHGFPHARYAALLDDVRRAAPRAVTPGSCGFAYAGDAAWMNHLVFPVTRERWCDDVAAAAPWLAGHVLPLDPGDVLTIEGGRVERAQPADFIERLAVSGPAPGEFRPVEAGGPLGSSRDDSGDPAALEALAVRELTLELPAFIAREPATFEAHRRLRVVHQVDLILPAGRRSWHFDHARAPVIAREGPDPRADLFTAITAAALSGLSTGERGWDHALLTGAYRAHSKLYTVGPDGLGAPDPSSPVRDPLRLRFPFDATLRRVLDRELDRWCPC